MALGSKAHFLYGQTATKNDTMDLLPRLKWAFKVSITHKNPAALSGLITTDFDRIASVSMPSYNVKSNTLNQYNKKRVVQTGIDYAPITMIVYDDRSATFEKFLKDYSNYYYAGSMNYGNTWTDFNNAPTGLKLQEEHNYIKTFTIERENSKTDKNIINIYNPILTNIDTDNLDYSDSGLIQYRLTFMYEGYNISTNGA